MCAQLVAGLVRAGYTVGLFSSPHLINIEERVRINGKSISAEDFDKALITVKNLEIELTFFEITYLVSLIACRDAGVSIMVLENRTGREIGRDSLGTGCRMLGHLA